MLKPREELDVAGYEIVREAWQSGFLLRDA